MTRNKKRHLELVPSDGEPESELDKVASTASDVGRRLVGDTIVPINSVRIDKFQSAEEKAAENEKKAVDRSARNLAIELAQLRDSYDAKAHRDISAAKLYEGLTLAVQAGRQLNKWLDMFVDQYIQPAHTAETREAKSARHALARMISGAETLQDAFEVLLVSTIGDEVVHTATVDRFQRDSGESRIWQDEERTKKLVVAVSNAHTIISYMAAREGLKDADAWLGICAHILTEKGLGIKSLDSDDEAEADEYNRQLDSAIDKGWKDWLPPIRHPIDIS